MYFEPALANLANWTRGSSLGEAVLWRWSQGNLVGKSKMQGNAQDLVISSALAGFSLMDSESHVFNPHSIFFRHFNCLSWTSLWPNIYQTWFSRLICCYLSVRRTRGWRCCATLASRCWPAWPCWTQNAPNPWSSVARIPHPRIFLWWSSLDCVSGTDDVGPACVLLPFRYSRTAEAARRGHRTVCFLQAFGVTTGNSHDVMALSCSTGASTSGDCPPGGVLWKLCSLKKI